MKSSESVRRTKIQEFLRLCEESASSISEKAKVEGRTLEDLQKILDRKAEEPGCH